MLYVGKNVEQTIARDQVSTSSLLERKYTSA